MAGRTESADWGTRKPHVAGIVDSCCLWWSDNGVKDHEIGAAKGETLNENVYENATNTRGDLIPDVKSAESVDSLGGPSPAEEFFLGLEEERGVPVVVAAGELDLYTAPRLRALLAEAMARAGGPRSGPRGGPSPGPPSVIVDLMGVTFADSMTLGTLIGERSTLKELGGDLHLVLEEGAVKRLLELVGLVGAFKIYPDRPSAAEEIKGKS